MATATAATNGPNSPNRFMLLALGAAVVTGGSAYLFFKKSSTRASSSPGIFDGHRLYADGASPLSSSSSSSNYPLSLNPDGSSSDQLNHLWTPPTRKEQINMLKGLEKDGSVKPNPEDRVFDLLIVGGGATGTGCAVDAATRGLKVALVERDDFASGKGR